MPLIDASVNNGEDAPEVVAAGLISLTAYTQPVSLSPSQFTEIVRAVSFTPTHRGERPNRGPDWQHQIGCSRDSSRLIYLMTSHSDELSLSAPSAWVSAEPAGWGSVPTADVYDTDGQIDAFLPPQTLGRRNAKITKVEHTKADLVFSEDELAALIGLDVDE